MSSDGDHVAVQTSMNDNLADASTVHFNDKNFTFITDSTSNSGSFSSGQIQFDLSTLNSQSQWINLSEAVIEFPVKITATLNNTATTTAAIHTAIIKNGWHQWIDSAQLIINGQTIQSAQPFENVAGTFRILSSWSQDTLKKWGPTCGFALDDVTNDTAAFAADAGYNLPSQTGQPRGLDTVNGTGFANKGLFSRASMTNSSMGSTLQTAILGAPQIRQAGRSHVASAGQLSNGSTAIAGAALYSAFYMATCRLKDLCDIGDFPMVKNLKGFLYLSFNSTEVNFTADVTTVSSPLTITLLTGRTTPFLIKTGPNGLVTGSSIIVKGTVDATTTGAVGNSGPLITNARLLCPYYIANPKTDMALSNDSKFFTTLEKIVNIVTVSAGSSVNYTITTGVPNPRRLVMLPMWQNLAGATALTNPEISCFDTVPATSGMFAGLQNLQVYVANKPHYQYPVQFDFEQWVSENSQLGLNGNLIGEDTSGLLTEQLFEQNHRFYSVDLSRRMVSEDGASKSVQVSFTNPSPNFGMKVICIVFYEKQWVINTSTCMLQNV